MIRNAEAGFTLIQTAVSLALIAVISGIAMPSMQQWTTDLRVRDAAGTVMAALSTARSEAIRTGNNHIVFFATDAQTNPLLDVAGKTVPILILDDGPPGSAGQNCRIDAGERTRTYNSELGIGWGVANASAAVPTDLGGGAIASGFSFLDTDGNAASWVLFRPEGIPVAFNPACTVGAPGSAGGAVYLNNGRRDAAVVMQPLGGLRVHVWDRSGSQWTN